MSGELFRAYVEQCLVPALERGDVVVMDNFAAHKVSGVQEAIEKAGATLHYLPKYSPDLNPIELPYSKFKDHLRKAAERTVRGPYLTIRAFVPQLGARECANHFRNAGYVFPYEREPLEFSTWRKRPEVVVGVPLARQTFVFGRGFTVLFMNAADRPSCSPFCLLNRCAPPSAECLCGMTNLYRRFDNVSPVRWPTRQEAQDVRRHLGGSPNHCGHSH
jgi:transposase